MVPTPATTFAVIFHGSSHCTCTLGVSSTLTASRAKTGERWLFAQRPINDAGRYAPVAGQATAAVPADAHHAPVLDETCRGHCHVCQRLALRDCPQCVGHRDAAGARPVVVAGGVRGQPLGVKELYGRYELRAQHPHSSCNSCCRYASRHMQFHRELVPFALTAGWLLRVLGRSRACTSVLNQRLRGC